MWRLDQFRFDEAIQHDEVDLIDDEATGGELASTARDEAIAIARARGEHLIAWWPAGSADGPPSCIIGKVATPLRWEELPDADQARATPDERLWFEASCGGRDFLVGNPHTFTGRMAAWCPHQRRGYNVSLSELGEMSDGSRYFIRGFLSGSEPGPPYGAHGDLGPADEKAWQAALHRFHQTGLWYGRWTTCRTCGCVLLPDTAADHCAAHPPPEP
jgi:hypothetical protein